MNIRVVLAVMLSAFISCLGTSWYWKVKNEAFGDVWVESMFVSEGINQALAYDGIRKDIANKNYDKVDALAVSRIERALKRYRENSGNEYIPSFIADDAKKLEKKYLDDAGA